MTTKCRTYEDLAYQCHLLPGKCVTYVEMGLRGMFGVGGGPIGLVGKGQSIHSMEKMWREFRILAQRDTTPN